MQLHHLEAMSPDEKRQLLADLAQRLFGPGAQDKAVAEAVGMSTRNAIRWRVGDSPVPTLVLAYLHMLAHEGNLAPLREASALNATARALDAAAEALRAGAAALRQLER